ncbi:hypothetical protein BBK14_32685 [Parafrankia soli]|uniref:Uncharacterized protein n=1 Tax=Parafrankia soli TaxID=2599596 RepID=A0A1S1R4I9_9ACTN|nr:tetratricopeptide repeat protein [Parafrankia soli]OHV40192.1 hypothetical protein BBK14_32685 [Parafrankia soli]
MVSGEPSSEDDAAGRLDSGWHSSMHNTISGHAGNVVQAGRIDAVHVHPAPQPVVRVPTQLPAAVGGFVDRRLERDHLDAIMRRDPDLARPTVVLVSGMRGVGKSAAAVRWAHEIRHRFGDGQLYAELGTLAHRGAVETGDVLRLFVRALGVDIDGVPLTLEELTAVFRDRTSGRRLLILIEDAASPAQVIPLLPASENSVVLVTSQYRLRGLLHDGAELLPLGPLSDEHGVDLLERMVGRSRLDAERDAARAIVRYCGGLPLALRMIGGRLKTRPGLRMAEVSRMMADERGRPTMPADDEQAIEAAFAVAYDGLLDDARALYRWLGLHPGSEVSADLVAAATGISRGDVDRLLDILVTANLLAEVGDDQRYRCHELLWAHARRRSELLDDVDVRDTAFRRLAMAYLRQAVYADHAVMGPRLRLAHHAWFAPEQSLFTTAAEALNWLETERRNLLGVVQEAAQRHWDSIVWWMCEALWALYLNRKHYAEWVESHELAVAATLRLGDRAAEARMRSQLARAQMELEQYHDARLELAAAAEAAVTAGNRRLEASVLEFTGRVLLEQGTDLAAAEAAFTAAIELNTDIGNRRGAAISLHHLGRAYRQQGRFDDSVSSLGQALAVFEELADEHNQGRILISLGEAQRDRGAYEDAKEALDRSIGIMRRRGVPFQIGQALEVLAALAHLMGDTATERRHQRDALDLYQTVGSPQAARLRAVLGIESEGQ